MPAHKTYMELVNDAIDECKVSLDPLTSLNFASPPRTILYNLFKKWTNRAYRSILIDRNEWYFRKERTTVTIHPRLQLILPGPGIVSVGNVLEGTSSGVQFEVVAVHSTEDAELNLLTEYTVSVEYVGDPSEADNLILNEKFDRVSPSPTPELGSIKGRGRYSFHELVTGFDELDERSVYIQPTVATASSPSPGDLQAAPSLIALPVENWVGRFDAFNTPSGRPGYIVRTDDGLYDFYPRPNVPYDVSFSYTQDASSMTLYNDTPVLLDPMYDEKIMWGAIMSYADYDRNTQLYSRAKKEYDKWDYIMRRDSLPTITLGLHRFDKSC